MRLWIKISLIAIIMVTLATSVCSLIMLAQSGQSNLDLAIDNVLTDQQLRATAWRRAMEQDATASVSSTTQRTLARYHIGQYADGNSILISDQDIIFNATGVDPMEYLPLTELEHNTQQYIIIDLYDQSMLITGSLIEINQTSYSLYVLRDITSVYSGIQALSYQFVLINLAVLLIGTVIIVMLVRLVLKPIHTLKSNTALIANGVYDKRIAIKENDEIGELAYDFNSMAAAVETHVSELTAEAQRRSLFMASLTHELKTPMTAISGNAQTLLHTKLSDDEREDALIAIDDACTRVERLSQKMMQLIVLQQGEEIELSSQSVDELLAIVRNTCTENLKQRDITLQINNSMNELAMDIDLLSSLFMNLIDNAAKASKPGDVILICAKDDTMTVVDHGAGIPPSDLEYVTQPFYMVDKSRSRKAGGIGLGLSLCDEIARLHGARLEVHSEQGKGTIVKVVFAHV